MECGHNGAVRLLQPGRNSVRQFKKVIDAVTEIADDIVLGGGERISPIPYLQRFLFSGADQQKYIHTLSGGERCRLHLAVVLMQQPNFLILDEPTNDLDIVTLGILEEFLTEFKGCLIVISHDRFFIDNTVDHIFVMQGNGVIKDFPAPTASIANGRTVRPRKLPRLRCPMLLKPNAAMRSAPNG